MVTLQPKTWHWSLGPEPGAKDLDLKRAIAHGGVCIHSVTDAWIQTHGSGERRKHKFQEFKETARPGDRIVVFCNGKIRASGTFTGEIFRISNEEALWCAEAGFKNTGYEHNITGPGTGSFKAMVYDWEVFEEPKDGAGLRGTLYEVKHGMKNYHNYQ
jgi:hypothetical protein